MEQEAGHFLVTQLASGELVIVLRVRHCRNDIQITDGAAVTGGSKERGELEADAVGGPALANSGQTSAWCRGLEAKAFQCHTRSTRMDHDSFADRHLGRCFALQLCTLINGKNSLF